MSKDAAILALGLVLPNEGQKLMCSAHGFSCAECQTSYPAKTFYYAEEGARRCGKCEVASRGKRLLWGFFDAVTGRK